MNSDALLIDAKNEAQQGVDFLVVFSHEDESNPFWELLQNCGERHGYVIGEIYATQVRRVYSVAIAVVGQGNVTAARATSRAINKLHPRAVILCGICGGIKLAAVNRGDIIIPRWIIPYENVKVTAGPKALAGEAVMGQFQDAGTFEQRLPPHDTSYSLWKTAEAICILKRHIWTVGYSPPVAESRKSLQIHCDEKIHIASGEKLIAHNPPDVIKKAIEVYKERLKGFEMEAFGVLSACRGDDLPFLMVKAVQDLGGHDQSNPDEKNVWRPIACRVASHFSKEVISSYEFTSYTPRVDLNDYGRICKDWHDDEISSVISHAQRSIDVVDTFYDEDTTLIPLVARAAERIKGPLTVDIHMLDPSGTFGGRRLLELHYNDRIDEVVVVNKDQELYENKYRALFRDECSKLFSSFRKNSTLNKYGITPKIWTYNCMPSMRMIVVDDRYFIVGWYPLNERNPGYPCVLVDSYTRSDNIETMAIRLRFQMSMIKKNRFRVTKRSVDG